MKKILMLTAAGLILQATPVLAEDHEGGHHKGDHKAKMFEKQDANGDGMISEAEFLDNAKKHFAEMDANGDGNVTKEEGKAAFEAKREKMKEKRKAWKEKRDKMKEERPDGAEE